MNTTSPSLFDRIVGSAIAKLAVMFFIVLLLLIPLSWVDDLIQERKQRHERVGDEIAMKWGGQQVVNGPVIAIPVEERQPRTVVGEDGIRQLVPDMRKEWIMLLPSDVEVTGTVLPETLKRGIYDAVVYQSDLKITGRFDGLDTAKLLLENSTVKWSEAKLVFGVSDLKGLTSSPVLTWEAKQVPLASGEYALNLFEQNLVADIPLGGPEGTNNTFDVQVELRGSKSLNFLPLASQTHIQLGGKWADPSFNGAFLPTERTVSESDFDARWEIPGFSRKQPQQWRGEPSLLYTFSGESLTDESAAGRSDAVPPERASTLSTDGDMVQVNFLPEVNHYQKTTRVTKYGILVVILTFASLFFTEIIKKRRIHVVQYVLIGGAMVLFYSLLLAMSEHIGFGWAYALAAVATIVLIALFVKAITRQPQTAVALGAMLSLCYGFIYSLLLLRDYALLVGTIGVFVMLAALMYFAARIHWGQWDDLEAKPL